MTWPTPTPAMHAFFPAWARCTVLFLSAGAGLSAQELTLLGGVMNSTQAEQSSYSWQVDYRQNFHRNFAASIAYLNEGHVTGHHRDGTAWQAWGRLPFFDHRVAVSLGLGAYYFYATAARRGQRECPRHGPDFQSFGHGLPFEPVVLSDDGEPCPSGGRNEDDDIRGRRGLLVRPRKKADAGKTG
jgi:hypothetical protein